ncbi:MAG TPA: DNA repair protein RadA [Candidatus Avacidaminococcus intestinavium]|uniref:DNA repair protein RadA n=1 Tax=Candidatus Avacidaminococcus intestinavium TaxID=2840684 RepID=A0A9D1MNK0_9FIRM|nr:DNA repair protein RadA [Candidatus Avacidaminococcus intestinavium]
MAKIKTNYVCQKCGYTTLKWLGKCPECGSWDSLVEERCAPEEKKHALINKEKAVPKTIDSVQTEQVKRMATGIREFDRVLGGGLVPGSLVLLGGDPGIGKSTIVLEAAMRFGKSGYKVFYVSGEESEGQTALRAKRLGVSGENVLIMTDNDLNSILVQAEVIKPDLLVIDSIQTMYNEEFESSAGSVGQVRECTAKLLRFSKSTGIAVLIIGHMTKEGNIAGPRMLEHMVDVVLQFEGERTYAYRILRALKNRFGSTNESGIFSMEEVGLKEVSNPSGLFLETTGNGVAGSVICACLEGTRPLLVEVQALVTRTPYGMPRRTAVGFDYNRVNMLLAILEKKIGLEFATQDVYINVVGGIKLTEPAADLAVIIALVSSLKDIPVKAGTLIIGEVGLTGEVRRVSAVERRVREALNLGFESFIIPFAGKKNTYTANVTEVSNVSEALQKIFK